jgi:hypothetical protein
MSDTSIITYEYVSIRYKSQTRLNRLLEALKSIFGVGVCRVRRGKFFLKLEPLRGDFGALICSLLTQRLQQFATWQKRQRGKNIPIVVSLLIFFVIFLSKDYRLMLAPKTGANTLICFLLTDIRNALLINQRYVTQRPRSAIRSVKIRNAAPRVPVLRIFCPLTVTDL